MTPALPLTSPTTPPPARRAARAGAVGVAAAALLAGCSESSGQLDRPEPESPRPDMAFAAEFHQTDTTVGWSWTLRNDDNERVLVFAGPESMWADEPPATWVLGAKGDTVELAQRLLATPRNVEFESPYGVAAQILDPGEELTGTAEAPLPLTTTLPWGADDDPSQAVPEHPSEVYLCVGVGTFDQFRYLLPDDPSPYATHGEADAASQHQFCTDTQPLR